jgi:peptidylprolyl isomerase
MPRRHRPGQRPILIASAVAAAALVIAGCSGDSTPSPATSAAADPGAVTSSAASVPAAGADTTEAADAYLTSNCALPGPGTPGEQAPADGQSLGVVTVTYDDQGVPQVTVGQPTPVADLQTLDLATGDGAEVAAGDVITFNYCGVGMTTRQIFDSSWARNEPLTYGLDELIPGWSVGIPGMRVGGQRLLVIPGDLGYGPQPNPASGILPDETLIFVVEVVAIGEES